MYGKLKSAEFLKFDFAINTSVQTELNCNTKFRAQSPEDPSILDRAILITFHAESEGDAIHLRCICRVVFSFTDIKQIPVNDDGFINEYYEAAYSKFCSLADSALVMFGQNGFEFQSIKLERP